MSDLSDKLSELGKKFEELRNEVKDLPQEWQEMNDACVEWQDDPEDVGKGAAWARRTAKVLSSVGGAVSTIIPDGVSDFVKELFTKLFKAIPTYVDRLTTLLVDRVGAVDKAEKSADTVKFGGGECTGGLLDDDDVKLLSGLNLSDEDKGAIFRLACARGLASAMKLYLTSG